MQKALFLSGPGHTTPGENIIKINIYTEEEKSKEMCVKNALLRKIQTDLWRFEIRFLFSLWKHALLKQIQLSNLMVPAFSISAIFCFCSNPRKFALNPINHNFITSIRFINLIRRGDNTNNN